MELALSVWENCTPEAIDVHTFNLSVVFLLLKEFATLDYSVSFLIEP